MSGSPYDGIDTQNLAIERWKQERDDLAAILKAARQDARQPLTV